MARLADHGGVSGARARTSGSVQRLPIWPQHSLEADFPGATEVAQAGSRYEFGSFAAPWHCDRDWPGRTSQAPIQVSFKFKLKFSRVRRRVHEPSIATIPSWIAFQLDFDFQCHSVITVRASTESRHCPKSHSVEMLQAPNRPLAAKITDRSY